MSPQPRSPVGFTVVELLVVIAIVVILAAMFFPALSAARSKTDSVKCVSNLRQIGAGVNLYCNDHDDFFPGPCWYGQSPWYNTYDSASLPYLLQKYLSLQPNQPWMQRADVFVCPAYERAVSIAGAPVYCTLALGSSKVRPWGYPPNGENGIAAYQPTRRRVSLSAVLIGARPASLVNSPALRDTDKLDYQTGNKPGWYHSLPDKPVHGDHQNALFFDFHVAPVDPVTHLPK